MDSQSLFEIVRRPLFTIGSTPVSLMTLFQFVVILVSVLLAARLVRRLLVHRILRRTRLDQNLQEAIGRITGYVVVLLGFMVGLSTLGFDLTSLTVLGGAVGVGLGFGLQNIVENFISGLIILGERPIQVGHRIEVGGTHGQVARIGARSTSILTNENIMLIIPNSEFISGRVTNWSHGGDRRVRIDVPVGVSYGSDPRLVERLLLQAAADNDNALKDPPPQVVWREFGDSSLNFDLRVWTETLFMRPGVFRRQIYFAVWGLFREHGVEIPFPQRDLHVRAPIQVEMRRGA